MNKSITFIFLLYLSLVTSWATPLTNPETNPRGAEDKTLWKLIAAEHAQQRGLFDLAENFYKQILEAQYLPSDTRNLVSLNLISSYISQKKFWEADQILKNIPNPLTEDIKLRKAIVSFYTEDLKNTEVLFKDINKDSISEADLPWYHLLEGMILQKKKHFRSAAPYLYKAKELAQTDYLKTAIDALIIRGEIFGGKADESLARNLQKKISRNKKLADLNFFKQYAIVLEKIGRSDEALMLLENTLQNLHYDQIEEAHSIRLLIALIAGPNSTRGEEALKKLLLEEKSKDTLSTALTMLAQAKLKQKDYTGLYDFLSQLIGTSKDQHPIIDQIYILRAQVALLNNNTHVAEKDATYLLETFPGSEFKEAALYLLAFVNWSSNPPKYRNSANYLTQLLQGCTTDKTEINYLSLIGDCYFLNSDFSNASAAYNEILDKDTANETKEIILLRLIVSMINEDKANEAQLIFDNYSKKLGLSSQYRWEIEWNLISALKNKNQIQSAFIRVQKLLNKLPSDDITPELHLQLLWLNAQLSFDTNNLAETEILTDSIIALAEKFPESSLSTEKKSIIKSNTLLLKAQTLYQLNRNQEATLVLEKLRLEFPESSSAVLSYIVEARSHSAENQSVPAQQQLIQLSDKYPNSEHAQMALYEAALNAESRGLTKTYQEALSILERLAHDYPSSRLVYYARIKQADILRKLNDFDGAQLIYENLINQYPSHPEGYKAELSRADCLLARGTKNPSRYKEAAAVYERLFDIQSLPIDLRTEAAFKNAFSQIKLSNTQAAEEIYWLAISKFLIEPTESIMLGPKGRYWMSRSIFELANLFEQKNETKQAKDIYKYILKYGLPGQAFAKTKI